MVLQPPSARPSDPAPPVLMDFEWGKGKRERAKVITECDAKGGGLVPCLFGYRLAAKNVTLCE